MKAKRVIKDFLIMVFFLLAAFVLSTKFSSWDVEEHISTIFVFAVFLISLLSSSYIWGVVSSFVGVVLINFVFTYPFFAFDFINPVNLVSAVIMLSVSILTSLIVTKEKEQERWLRESEKERVRANLLRAVSHDIRTPLTTINSASSLLLDETNLSEEQKNALLINIRDESEWLTGMVENLLSITRLGDGEIEIRKTPTIVDELIDSALTKFRRRHPGENVLVTLPDEIITIKADALLIEEVLLNLLDNAAIHAEGHTMIELEVTEERDTAVFRVSDDGCGLGDRADNIFSSFGSSGDSRFSGIGLSVSETIIRAHGSTIKAGNNEDRGAFFTFKLERDKSVE